MVGGGGGGMAISISKLNGWKPTILMVLAMLIFSGMNVLLKLALHDGIDPKVIVAYRFLFGAAFIIPTGFFLERKERPKLDWKVLLFALLSGLFGGALAQNLLVESLALTSATFISAMVNLIPAITFIVAVCLRLENLGLHTPAGKAKVLGTLIGIGGAMLFTFYKGPGITIWETNVNLMNITNHHPSDNSEGSNLVLGIILSMISCVCYSLWLIAQAKAAKIYPSPISFTALMVSFATIWAVVFAVCMQRDWSQWKLGWNIRLLAVAYSGIVGTGLMFTLIALCVAMRGPLFVSVFNPLVLIIVAMAGSLVLDEKLHLGSLLGAIVIIFGLYVVLWGKGKEMKKINQLVPEETAMVEDQVREKSKDKIVNQLMQVEIAMNKDEVNLIDLTITTSGEK